MKALWSCGSGVAHRRPAYEKNKYVSSQYCVVKFSCQSLHQPTLFQYGRHKLCNNTSASKSEWVAMMSTKLLTTYKRLVVKLTGTKEGGAVRVPREHDGARHADAREGFSNE